jgi:hypothetical protein
MSLALPGRRRRRRRLGGTHVLGAMAVSGTIAAVALEYVHVWRKGSAPLLDEVEGTARLAAGAEAALETVEVAVEGYRGGSARENALLNVLVAFSLTLGAARASTHVLRASGGRPVGPFRNVSVGRRHIHHFVPGIALAFVAGGTSILSRNERLDPWLAVPFGAGAALTLDESALLLLLDDVYWTEEGVVSVQIALGAMALLSAGAVTLRMLRRGEREVLGSPEQPVGSA